MSGNLEERITSHTMFIKGSLKNEQQSQSCKVFLKASLMKFMCIITFIKEWTCWRGFFFTVCPLITTNVKLMLFFKKSLLIFFYFAPPFPMISNIILDRTPSSTSWIIKSYAFPMPPSCKINISFKWSWIKSNIFYGFPLKQYPNLIQQSIPL